MAITAQLISRSATREVWDVTSTLDNEAPNSINIAHQLDAVPSEVTIIPLAPPGFAAAGQISAWSWDTTQTTTALARVEKTGNGAVGAGAAVPQVRFVIKLPHSILG